MINILFKYSLGLIIMILSVIQTCEDIPNFDYESHPNQSFEFRHMEMNATLEPELNLVRGVVTYSVSSKANGLTELIIQTSESAIDDVVINDVDTEFRVSNDSLIVQLPDSSKDGEEFTIAITWQSNSRFGLYKDSKSNFWSSKNPLAHHHWFPVFDHPRNELTFDAYFSIPYESEVLFNGDLVSNEMASATKKEIHYQSKKPVPVTGLGFALGDFVISEVTSGLTSIKLFSPEKGVTEENRVSLIREASKVKKEIEKTLSMEYPWEGLNVVVLPDNFWEERTHGTGTIFLYENVGSLSAQLKRGLYAQWFGEYQRGEQFFDFDNSGEELIRTALHFSINKNPILIENPDTLNTIYSWNKWQNSFLNESELFKQTVISSLPEIIRAKKGITEFSEYAEVWYKETGVPWFNISFEESEIEQADNKVLSYSLNAEYDEATSKLNLIFELQEGSGEELYTLKMTEYSFSDSINHEVNFTGELDTASFELSPSVEFVSFHDGTYLKKNIIFSDFPLFFLLNQLRSTNPDDRRIAAILLSKYSDNPDLQLALNDVTNAEPNAMVRAALLSTMATITNGAKGTEQQFLNGLNSPEIEIQEASLKALANYPEDELVKSSIRTKVLRSENENIFKLAVSTYSAVATSDELVTLIQRLERVDSTGSKSLYVMSEYPESDSNGAFIALADGYLMAANSYSVRKVALDFLLQNDISSDRWITRFNTLIADRDPRIRHRSLSAVKWLTPSEALKVLGTVEQNEFDARVLLEVDNLLEQISK